MAEPFYAEFAARHADTAAMTDVTRQFLLVAQHLRDSTTGLYYHAWDSARRQPWADPRPDDRRTSGVAPSAGT